MKIGWLAVDKIIAKISRLTFLAHPIGNGRYSSVGEQTLQAYIIVIMMMMLSLIDCLMLTCSE